MVSEINRQSRVLVVLIAGTFCLSIGVLSECLAQGVYYSTSTSLRYSTESLTTTVATTKTDLLLHEWFSMQVRSTNIEEMDRFVVKLEIRSVHNQGLFDVQIAVGFRFRDGTWSRPYLGSVGDFEAGQLKTLDLLIRTDFNLYEVRQPEESDIKLWKMYYIVARTRELTVTTHTQTQLITFTSTAPSSISLTTSSSSATDQTQSGIMTATIGILALIIVALAAVYWKKQRVISPPISTQSNVEIQDKSERGKKYCISCGAQIPSESEFCTKCGKEQK